MIHVDGSGIFQCEAQMSPFFGIFGCKRDRIFFPVFPGNSHFLGLENLIILADQFNTEANRSVRLGARIGRKEV